MRVAGRLRVGTVVAALMVIVSNSAVHAGDTCPAGTLGVSRILEVDTSDGPWFGEPNGDPNFLAPGEVVLTFDDGPSPRVTHKVLAAFAKNAPKPPSSSSAKCWQNTRRSSKKPPSKDTRSAPIHGGIQISRGFHCLR